MFSNSFLNESVAILRAVDCHDIEGIVNGLDQVRSQGGRIFCAGVGGSAAHASHFVNDLRKLAMVEAYCPSDNVSELTARTNDEGWETVFEEWLKISRAKSSDGLFIFSVGGGDSARGISVGLIRAAEYMRGVNGQVLAILGRNGGEIRRLSSSAVLVPDLFPERVTPHTEGLMSVIAHLIVSHPKIQKKSTKW